MGVGGEAAVRVYYAYPMWHTVSFSLIAKKHIEYMRKRPGVAVYEIDELQVPNFVPHARGTLVVHPAFFIMTRVLDSFRKRVEDLSGWTVERYYSWWRAHIEQLVGVDVCDSDRYSELAVELANMLDKFILPSRYCVEVARRSGVKTRVFYVPHGVDPEWYTTPNLWEAAPVSSLHPALIEIYLYKRRKGKRVLLYWLWHSSERKGFPELAQVYRRLAQRRRDVILVMKTTGPTVPELMSLVDVGVVGVYGWLDDTSKMALYDLADVTLNFSRGGGFELNCLESLARGTPCVASEHGSWTEYVPRFLQVKKGRRVQPLPGNQIHAGYGYAVDVDDAVEKLDWILDNYEEVKARTEEWREKFLSRLYRWDIIADRLLYVLEG